MMDMRLNRDDVDGNTEEKEGWEDSRERRHQELDRRHLAVQQTRALLKRNLIERRRTKGTTFCELCSPVLLLCVLVYGYSLSDVLLFPAKSYSSVRLDLPGGFGGLLPLARLEGQGLVDANSSVMPVGSAVTSDSSLGGAPFGPPDTADADADDTENSEELSYNDVKNVFNEMTGLLDGPFPVPTLDQFVGLGTAVAGDLGDGAYAEVVNSMESGWTFGNIITQGTLHFAPARDPAVGELVSWLSNSTEGFDALTHRVHDSEDDAISYALDHLEERTWAVIALDEAADGRVDYTIRMNFTVVPNTNEVVDMIAIGLDPRFRSYYLSGYLTLQTTLDRFMFKRALPASSADASEDAPGERFACTPPDVIGVPFPTAAYDQNLFYAAVGYLLGLAMTMSTMYPLSRLVKGIVEEKESRVRETMRIMGLRAWTHELSWLLTGAAVFSFIAVSVAALLSWTFLPLADGTLLLLFMVSFTCSEVGMALAVSSLFSKAKLASIAAPCVLFAGVLPRYIFYGSNRHEAPRSKTFVSLLSPTAFTFGADFIADYEYAGVGAGWGNYNEGEYSLRTSITMMFLDAALYGVLAWYLDKVVPPEYGTSRNPLKVLTSLPKALLNCMSSARRRSFPSDGRGWAPVVTDVDMEAGPHGEAGTEGSPDDFEPLEEGADGVGGGEGVIISGLRKEFGSKVAVVGLNLRLLPGDITCLLGHNGAGKSTTISMLTGQLGPTSGDAVVWGHSLRRNLPKVRQSIGICPQHDALMPLLTAREHIEMYMDIKGMDSDLKGPMVTKKLRDVGLLEKEHTQSIHLSGGQKRKLSVALALTGSPALCILDEPTSGMDPYSRRFTWDLLRRGRAGRCTLLSTHFMEEAEHLGDRVAMLRKGRLRCVGSPLFLKTRFGLGYKLTLVEAGERFNANHISSLVTSHVTKAEMLSSAGGEISFRLPREESARFSSLFRALEVGREGMGIGGYGVSITSLEEVFLSLEREGKRVDAEALLNGRSSREHAVSYGNGRSKRGGRNGEKAVGAGEGCKEGDENGRKSHSNATGGETSHVEKGSMGFSSKARSQDATASELGEIEMQSITGVTRSTSNGNDTERTRDTSKRNRDDHRHSNGCAPTNGHGKYGRLAHDDEDRAALLAEGQEDGQFVPADLASDVAGSPEKSGGSGAGEAKGEGADLWEQLCWLLWKRRVVALRDWRGGLYQVFLPALLVALVLVLLTIDVGLVGPSLTMSAEMFGGPTQVLYAEGRGRGPPGSAAKYGKVAEANDAWTRVNAGDSTGLIAPTSAGLSEFLLDTYDQTGSGQRSGDDSLSRLPRYGAFVFGDRIPLNITVDWDRVRERPELLGMALQIASENIPAEGGEFDLKTLMEASGADKDDVARLIVDGSDRLNSQENSADDVLGFLLPAENVTATDGDGGFLNATERWTNANWTERWFDLVDEDPTIRFTDAEYLSKSSELEMDGVILSIQLPGQSKEFDLGDVTISVDDILNAIPPGTRRYDKGMLEPNETTATVMFNTSAPHALPAWVGELTATTFEACAVERGLQAGEVSYTTRSHPLPLTATESLEVQTMLSLLVSLLVTIPLCYAPAAFVTFLVRERACKSKRVQLVSGASPLAYWMSAYIWDVLLFFILTVLVMLAFAAYGRDASKVFMMHWDALLGTWGLLISYGMSALPLSYLYSFGFDGPSAAQISIAGVNFLSGFGFVIAYAVLSTLTKTAKFAARAQHVFRLFPPYLLGDGLLKVSSEFYLREVLGMNRKWGVMAWDVAGKPICYMCAEAIGYLTLVLIVEYSLAAGVRAKADRFRLRLGGWSDQNLAAMITASKGPDEDCDVKAERLRVDEAMTRARREGNGRGARHDDTNTVLIRGLTKVYPAPVSSVQKRPKAAVRGLSLGVNKGECFGLLGINGAGKSTTLQILTRDLQATSGNISVDGKPITSSSVCRLLGYCPQTDPLLPLMSVNETLLLYGGLKGVGTERTRGWSRRRGTPDSLQREATAALSAVSLGPTEKQLAGTLSGGNKRKLSLAMALIGGPPVLLLDEPSSGMDPGARRSMWEVISSLAASRSVVLTTHSMEECEAVCDRLGIMVGGRLRCLGASQHLKGRFGGGYSIEVRCPTASMDRVKEMFHDLSPLARLDEMHPTLAKFSIPAGGDMDDGSSSGLASGGLSLSKAFEAIESKKHELQIWDYSINQATLETIFMSFAKNQEEETATVPGVSYDDATNLTNDANRTDDLSTSSGGLDEESHPFAPSMDVEMGALRRGRRRRARPSHVTFADDV